MQKPNPEWLGLMTPNLILPKRRSPETTNKDNKQHIKLQSAPLKPSTFYQPLQTLKNSRKILNIYLRKLMS